MAKAKVMTVSAPVTTFDLLEAMHAVLENQTTILENQTLQAEQQAEIVEKLTNLGLERDDWRYRE